MTDPTHKRRVSDRDAELEARAMNDALRGRPGDDPGAAPEVADRSGSDRMNDALRRRPAVTPEGDPDAS